MRSGFMRHVSDLIKQSDIILEIVDSRFPDRTRNRQLEREALSHRKKLIIVINKADIVPKEEVEKRKEELRQHTRAKVIFLSAKDRDGINLLRKEISYLTNGEKVTIGVIGYPNVGKSSLINALAGRGRARVATSRKAGLTRGLQKIKITEGIYLIDSPGIIPFGEDEFDLFLVDSKNPNQLKEPEDCAIKLISLIGKEKIAKSYGILLEEIENIDEEGMLELIGKKKNLLQKGGEAATDKAARDLLEKYQRHEV